jgi:threonyl-tRNA synthetase
MRLHEFYYKSLGITDYHLEMALRDPNNKKKYHGDEKMWQLSEKLMREAVSKVDIPMVEEEGSAAFYGPKIDFIIHSSIGREFAVSTNQVDLYMGKRFGLEYTDADGKTQTPAIIHRAPLGSHERFIGFLIEHFGGAFPVWLSPVQAVVIPISNDQDEYAENTRMGLVAAGIRAEVWNEAESMQKRIRKAEKLKIPYMLIVGEREAKDASVAVRVRGEKDLGKMKVSQLADKIRKEIENKAL